MAIEDMIWGQKRHMFGGIEPNEVSVFKAGYVSSGEGTVTVRMYLHLPDDTIIGEQTVCTVAGVIVRGSFTGYPEDEFSGILVGDFTEDGEYDVELTYDEGDPVLYLSAFAYSDQGVFNRNATCVNADTPISTLYLYGYDLDTTNPDPEARVTYPEDVDNYRWTTPAGLNSSSIFEYGDWAIAPGNKFMPRPCMLKHDGTVDYYLDPDDYTKKEDGTESDINNNSYDGKPMMQWPKIYTKRWEKDGIYHFRCSGIQHEGYECWCNYDADGNEIDYFYTGIGINTEGTVTYSEATSIANSLSDNNSWDVLWITDHLLIQDLLVMMGKSTDTQTVFGTGEMASYNDEWLGDDLGLFGVNASYGVKVFGMAHYWSEYYGCFIGGLESNGGVLYAEALKNSVETLHSFAIPSTNVICGYPSEMITYDWGRLPSVIGGSSSTYECDYFRIYTKSYNSTTLHFETGTVYDSTSIYDSTINATGAFAYNSEYGMYSNYRLSCKPTKS